MWRPVCNRRLTFPNQESQMNLSRLKSTPTVDYIPAVSTMSPAARIPTAPSMSTAAPMPAAPSLLMADARSTWTTPPTPTAPSKSASRTTIDQQPPRSFLISSQPSTSAQSTVSYVEQPLEVLHLFCHGQVRSFSDLTQHLY